MTDTIKTKSRRRTPWTGADASTPLQAFIDTCTERDCSHRHPALRASGEAEWLNAHEVTACRFCGSGRITKEGCSDNGIRRYGYDSKEIRRLPDSKNPLNRVNQMCRLVQMFLHSHSGFPRFGIQGYLNMFRVMTNPPDNKYEKIERLLDLGIRKSVLLRYRPENR